VVRAASPLQFGRRTAWLDEAVVSGRGWLPDLLTTINWKSKTGGSDIGSGLYAIQAGLTAVKRRDPLAFFGSVAQTWNLSERQSGNDVDEGNTVGAIRHATRHKPRHLLRFASMSAALDEMN
jgi:hypothetical protein